METPCTVPARADSVRGSNTPGKKYYSEAFLYNSHQVGRARKSTNQSISSAYALEGFVSLYERLKQEKRKEGEEKYP